MNQRGNSLMVGIVVGFMIAGGLFGAYYLGSIKNSQPPWNPNPANQFQLIPQPTKSNQTSTTFGQDETAHWKTYSNQDFGVSFKYPETTFVYQANTYQYSQYWSNKTNGRYPMELGQDGIWMNLSVTKLDDAGYGYWKNETISGNWKITHDLPKPNSEAAYGYSAVQLKGKTLYKLSIGAFTDENLVKYKNTFDLIISTFKFIN